MTASIVRCSCGAFVYISSKNSSCPDCKNKIHTENGDCYVSNNDKIEPLLCVFKFLPSQLSYFNSEYPEIGQNIIIIMENRKAYVNEEWSQDMQDEYELNYYSYSEKVQKLSWIKKTRKEIK